VTAGIHNGDTDRPVVFKASASAAAAMALTSDSSRLDCVFMVAEFEKPQAYRPPGSYIDHFKAKVFSIRLNFEP